MMWNVIVLHVLSIQSELTCLQQFTFLYKPWETLKTWIYLLHTFTDKSQQIHSSQTPQNSPAVVHERAFCCHVCAWGGITSETPESYICFFRSDLWRPHEELLYFYKGNVIINKTFALTCLCLSVRNVIKSGVNTKTVGGIYSIDFTENDTQEIEAFRYDLLSASQQMLQNRRVQSWSAADVAQIGVWGFPFDQSQKRALPLVLKWLKPSHITNDSHIEWLKVT